jgi:hypothetical protein
MMAEFQLMAHMGMVVVAAAEKVQWVVLEDKGQVEMAEMVRHLVLQVLVLLMLAVAAAVLFPQLVQDWVDQEVVEMEMEVDFQHSLVQLIQGVVAGA